MEHYLILTLEDGASYFYRTKHFSWPYGDRLCFQLMRGWEFRFLKASEIDGVLYWEFQEMPSTGLYVPNRAIPKYLKLFSSNNIPLAENFLRPMNAPMPRNAMLQRATESADALLGILPQILQGLAEYPKYFIPGSYYHDNSHVYLNLRQCQIKELTDPFFHLFLDCKECIAGKLCPNAHSLVVDFLVRLFSQMECFGETVTSTFPLLPSGILESYLELIDSTWEHADEEYRPQHIGQFLFQGSGRRFLMSHRLEAADLIAALQWDGVSGGTSSFRVVKLSELTKIKKEITLIRRNFYLLEGE